VGPRVQRRGYDVFTGTLNTARNQITDDALGGRAYYKGRVELEIPLGSGAKGLGIRPSLFMDVGSVFSVRRPVLTTLSNFTDPADNRIKFQCRNSTTGTTTFATLQVPAAPPSATNQFTICPTADTPFAPFDEVFLGDTWKPRLSVGFGFNWRSPFGPFRIDIAKALLKEPGDETKLFTFNVGTQF
jgi:outer membrane protein insertion porin family